MDIAKVTWPKKTSRLVLRPPNDAEIEQLLTWRNHPDVTRWLIKTTIEPEEFRNTWVDQRADAAQHWSIVLSEGAIVGIAELRVSDGMGQMHVDDGSWRACEGDIGYLLDPAHAGKGYGAEIAAALLEIAFEDLGVRRVTAGCFADNIASWKIMEKVGMRREQHGVQDSWHAERGWIDGYTYAILADEWRTSRTP